MRLMRRVRLLPLVVVVVLVEGSVPAAPMDRGSALDLQLVRELRATFPRLKALLAADQPDQEQVRATLMRLLDSIPDSPSERQPVLLLAADRLAAGLWVGWQPASSWKPQRKQLPGYQLTYEWVPRQARWAYMRDLQRRVWENYADTEWGELTFVLLTNQGWDTSSTCANGRDQFREVIQRGEEFLAARPESPHRMEVVFALAQAYETWFSLSQASGSEGGPSYREGADEARAKAVAYYNQVVQAAPKSEQAAYVQQRLSRLKLSLDTNQRRFYCVYN